MKNFLLVALFWAYSSIGFSQIYGVGNGSGQAVNCIEWNFGAVILPVNLISLDAACSGDKVVIRWSTLPGSNSDNFNIERSGDGINFQSLGNGYIKKTHNNKNYFSFTDKQVPSGRAYYRLVQIQGNGQIDYSQVVSAGCSSGNDPVVNVYPNPSSGLVNIKTGTSTAMLVIRNSMGQALLQTQAKPLITTIDLEHFPPGVYYVEVHTTGRPSYHKVVVRRN